MCHPAVSHDLLSKSRAAVLRGISEAILRTNGERPKGVTLAPHSHYAPLRPLASLGMLREGLRAFVALAVCCTRRSRLAV